MKIFIFAMATAIFFSLTFTSCGSKSSKDKDKDDEELVMDKGEEAVKAYEKLVEKYGDAIKGDDLAKLAEFAEEAKKLGEKFKDVELTDDQKKKIEELTSKFLK